MAILAKYKLDSSFIEEAQIVSTVYYCLLNPTTYINLETVVGVKKVTNQQELTEPNTSISELIKCGLLQRINVSGKNNAGQRRSYDIVVLRSRMNVILTNLIGKSIQGIKITSVGAKRKATFY